jgi:hypothetical protein
VAKAIGWDDNWGPQRVAKLTQHMLWENGYSTMQFASQDGGNYWTEYDQEHANFELVAYLEYTLRRARDVPDLPFERQNRVMLDELRAMATTNHTVPDYSEHIRRDTGSATAQV